MTNENTNEDQIALRLRQARSTEVVTSVVTTIIYNGKDEQRSGINIAADIMSAYVALIIVAKAIDLGQEGVQKIIEYVDKNVDEYASISAELLRDHLSKDEQQS